MRTRQVRRPEQFDVIDERIARGIERFTDSPSVIRQCLNLLRVDAQAVLGNQENQLPPHATSPQRRPMPGTLTAACCAERWLTTFETLTSPSAPSSASMGPTGASILTVPGLSSPEKYSGATRPMVP